jgi:hypothetical protein
LVRTSFDVLWAQNLVQLERDVVVNRCLRNLARKIHWLHFHRDESVFQPDSVAGARALDALLDSLPVRWAVDITKVDRFVT